MAPSFYTEIGFTFKQIKRESAFSGCQTATDHRFAFDGGFSTEVDISESSAKSLWLDIDLL